MQQDSINLQHYISVVTNLAFKACQIAKECAQNPNLKKYEKGVNDPVTEADYKIQTMIIRGLRHFFPALRIVGQQTTQYKGEIQLDLSLITLNNFPPTIGLNESVPLNQLCVWIDPIDNTKGFINGTLDCVTVLIGLSRNKRAYIGVVGLPYLKNQNGLQFKPEVLIGSVQTKKGFSTFKEHQWNQIHLQKPNIPLVFSISDTRGFSNTIEQVLKKHSATLVRVGGSGKKIAQVIKGQTDALLYLRAANHKWDSCAGQAIILAIGGNFSDSKGHPIIYDPESKSTVNQNGNICISDSGLYHSIILDLNDENAKM